MFGLFKPVAHIERLPEGQIDPIYKRLRWQLFLSIFIGYAGYYLVRKNFTLAMPFLIEEYGYSRGDLGVALAAGLVMSALVMLCFGFMLWAAVLFRFGMWRITSVEA